MCGVNLRKLKRNIKFRLNCNINTNHFTLFSGTYLFNHHCFTITRKTSNVSWIKLFRLDDRTNIIEMTKRNITCSLLRNEGDLSISSNNRRSNHSNLNSRSSNRFRSNCLSRFRSTHGSNLIFTMFDKSINATRNLASRIFTQPSRKWKIIFITNSFNLGTINLANCAKFKTDFIKKL